MLIEFHCPAKLLKLSSHRCHHQMSACKAYVCMPGIKLPIHQFLLLLCESAWACPAWYQAQTDGEQASKSDGVHSSFHLLYKRYSSKGSKAHRQNRVIPCHDCSGHPLDRIT